MGYTALGKAWMTSQKSVFQRVEESDLRLRLPPLRPLASHKRSFGRLQLVAGSSHYPGAAILCALGAFKAGCGYVCLESDAPVEVLRDLPELIPGFFSDSDAFVLGPGLDGAWTAERLKKLCSAVPKDKPILLDGSALKYFAELELRGRSLVLTPHEGEFAALLGSEWSAEKIREDRPKAVEEFKKRYPELTLLLKGAPTLIHGDGQSWSMDFGSVAMATAGQGDLLAGVLGAYLALGMKGVDAAILASSLCALAARELSKNQEPQGVLAHEVAAGLAAAVARLRRA